MIGTIAPGRIAPPGTFNANPLSAAAGVAALELVKNKETREAFPEDMKVGTICRDFCFNNGLIMRAVDDKMIISPPLIMTNDETDELVEKARLCLDLTAKQIGIS